MKILFVLLISLATCFSVAAQNKDVANSPALSEAETLAKQAFEAHGGEKLRALSTLRMTGSVDLTAMNQQIPATFIQVFSGEKYRLEVSSAFVNFLQVFDGVRTSTSPEQGVALPPINKVGFFMLQNYGSSGFVVSEAADEKKKGFRITSPDGYYTDFRLDKKTGRIKEYDASYFVGGRAVTTLVEMDKFEELEGIVFPSKYAQKFEVSGITVYAVFKSKEISVNKEVADASFTLGG